MLGKMRKPDMAKLHICSLSEMNGYGHRALSVIIFHGASDQINNQRNDKGKATVEDKVFMQK